MADEASHQQQTQAYYEEEARRQLRKPQYGRNLELRAEAVQRFVDEGATRVLDVGSGPGLDGETFTVAGCSYVGVDVAVGNGHRAAERGIRVVPASATHLPFGDGTFDAAWSMSTYMHLEVDAMATAVLDLARVLRPNGVAVISMWGGDEHDSTHGGIEGQTRHYFLRPVEENQAIFAESFTIESCRTWPDDHGLDWDQQLFVLRHTDK